MTPGKEFSFEANELVKLGELRNNTTRGSHELMQWLLRRVILLISSSLRWPWMATHSARSPSCDRPTDSSNVRSPDRAI